MPTPAFALPLQGVEIVAVICELWRGSSALASVLVDSGDDPQAVSRTDTLKE